MGATGSLTEGIVHTSHAGKSSCCSHRVVVESNEGLDWDVRKRCIKK